MPKQDEFDFLPEDIKLYLGINTELNVVSLDIPAITQNQILITDDAAERLAVGIMKRVNAIRIQKIITGE